MEQTSIGKQIDMPQWMGLIGDLIYGVVAATLFMPVNKRL